MDARDARIPGKLAVAVAVLIFAMEGCGGGAPMATQNPSPPSPPPSTLSMHGSWVFLFHSDVSDSYEVLEANLSQSGNHVSADKSSALVFQPTTQTTIEIQMAQLGGKCDSSGVGDVTIDATITDPNVSLTLSETGALGTAVATVSASTNGMSISNGTYSTPAACGFPEDHGAVQGFQDSITFSGEHYSGTFNSGADVIAAQFTSTPNSFDLTMSGTDNGTPFNLTGSTVGLSLALTGTFGGGEVSWFGLYDPLYNNFYVYDLDGTFLGDLESTP